MLAAQFPNGGWPQVYPLEGGYHDNITYNDNAMLHILQLLSDIATQRSEFSFVDRNTRKLCDAAFKKGVRCIFATQVVQDGRPTVWCAQHDPISLAPVAARRMEPASLSGGESAEIVRYLMDLDINSRTLDGSITAAKAWYRNHQMTGIRRDDSVQPKYFVSDPAATEVYWARFYHLETDQPVFAGPQDGFIYDDFETMASANRVGYDFYVNRPARLLELSAQR